MAGSVESYRDAFWTGLLAWCGGLKRRRGKGGEGRGERVEDRGERTEDRGQRTEERRKQEGRLQAGENSVRNFLAFFSLPPLHNSQLAPSLSDGFHHQSCASGFSKRRELLGKTTLTAISPRPLQTPVSSLANRAKLCTIWLFLPRRQTAHRMMGVSSFSSFYPLQPDLFLLGEE